MNRLDHALALARQGFYISPLLPGQKTPSGKWKDMRSTDETTIRNWFDKVPNMNYAVNFGDRGFMIDPDFDPSKGKNGPAELASLEADNFEEPISGETFTVQTPRGGQHLYFLSPYPITNQKGRLPPGIDVRGKGGYVVGPGCHTEASEDGKTAEGEYIVVCDKPPMEAPEWLLSLLNREGGRNEHEDVAIAEYDLPANVERGRGLIRQQTQWAVEGNGGNSFTYNFVCFLRDYALSQDTIYDLLNEPYGDDEESWNERCSPSWSEDELRTLIENAFNYATNAPGQKGGMLDSSSELDSITDRYIAAGEAESAQVKEDEKLAEKRALEGLDAMCFQGDALIRRENKHFYIIEDWLLGHGVAALRAKRGTGKTVVMIDMALRLACDMDWWGKNTDKGWSSVYICAEDDEGLQTMMTGWSIQNDKLPAKDRFIVMTGSPNLLDGGEVRKWAEYLKTKLGKHKAVVFVDTWQRVTASVSQNDDSDMQVAIKNAEWLARELGGPVVIAFHPPKNNEGTITGSMVIENSTTSIWSVVHDSFCRRMTNERIKGKGEGMFQRFRWDSIKTGKQDQWGKDVTSPILGDLGGSEHETESFDGVVNQVKGVYASVIRDLIMEAENDDEFVKNRGKFFHAKDTAQRIIALFDRDPNNRYKRKLAKLGNNDYSTESTLRRKLGDMFRSSGPVLTDDMSGNVWLTPIPKGQGVSFIIGEPDKKVLADDDEAETDDL